jgi:hypothetical protein
MEPEKSQALLMNSAPTPQQGSQRQRRKLRFSPKEDAVIMSAKMADPPESWNTIAKRLKRRTARQCRDRWMQYLAPEINSGPWTPEEDQLLVDKINEIGTIWVAMKPSFKGRSDIALKNRWNSHIKSKTVHDGTKFIYTDIDPNSLGHNQRKRLTCLPEAVLAILKEHRLLPEKINEMGTDFAAIATGIDRRSETVDDGKAVFSMPQEESASESLRMDWTREGARNLWDQMTTEDEWLSLIPPELE